MLKKNVHVSICMDLDVPCISHLENRSNEKIVAMILLEGLCRRHTGVGAKVYFKKLDTSEQLYFGRK